MNSEKCNRLDHYPFIGQDWYELIKAWNVYVPEDFYMPDPEGKYGFHPTCYEIDPLKWYMMEVMKQYKGDKVTRSMHKCCKDLRIFLNMLGDPEKCNTYTGPLWIGLSKIQDDWTLISYSYDLIQSMWD